MAVVGLPRGRRPVIRWLYGLAYDVGFGYPAALCVGQDHRYSVFCRSEGANEVVDIRTGL
jgi:hypothetical protein